MGLSAHNKPVGLAYKLCRHYADYVNCLHSELFISTVLHNICRYKASLVNFGLTVDIKKMAIKVRNLDKEQ
jgi:membrane-bound lytic murein transglycosylase MltF